MEKRYFINSLTAFVHSLCLWQLQYFLCNWFEKEMYSMFVHGGGGDGGDGADREIADSL